MSAAGGSVPTGRKLPDYNYPGGIKPIVRGKPGTTHLQAESTGLQLANLGVYSLNPRRVNRVKTLGTYFYHNINQWVMNSSQGLQCVDFPENILTRAMMVGDTNNQRGERFRWADDPFLLNPYSTRPTNALYTVAQVPAISNNDVLYIKNCAVTMELLSMSLLPQKVSIYWCAPKYDTNVNPIDTWNSIISAKNDGQTASGPAVDLTTPTATSGQASATNPGSNPFIHKEFTQMWSSVATQKIALQAGEQINFKAVFEYEKMISRDTLANHRTHMFMKGFTLFPLFIVQAGLVGIAGTETTEALEVSYGEVKLGVVMNQRYTFGALPANRKSSNRLYPGTLETVASGAVAEAQRVFGDDDNIKLGDTQV